MLHSPFKNPSKLDAPSPDTYGLQSNRIVSSFVLPNTEIGFRTMQCNTLFFSLLELTPKDAEAETTGDIKTPIEIAAD